MGSMELRESKIRQQMEVAKSWAQVVKEPSVEKKEIMERKIKRQVREEKDRKVKATNVIIKGLKEFGEK